MNIMYRFIPTRTGEMDGERLCSQIPIHPVMNLENSLARVNLYMNEVEEKMNSVWLFSVYLRVFYFI